MVRGRLCRTSNPALALEIHDRLIYELMDARRAVRHALGSGHELAEARAVVHRAKVALGKGGPPWWTDGAKDFNRHMAKNASYAEWATDQ